MQNSGNDQICNDLIEYVAARKITRGKSFDRVIAVINEMPLTLFVNGEEIVTLLCSGAHPVPLAVGFLRSEGLLENRESIIDISLNKERDTVSITLNKDTLLEKDSLAKRTITSGCGKGTMFYQAIGSLLNATIESPLSVTSDQVFTLMSQFNRESTLYRSTRGVHNAALATPGSILFFRSDIGRHNAVDMICGECFLKNIPMDDKLLLTTGRITSEILLKAARMRTPFLISRNVATYHSIILGQRLGITLIGDVRGTKFFSYTHLERVIL